MHHLFTFPGDPFVSRILTAGMRIGFQFVMYLLCVVVLRRYINPSSTGTRALGVILGGGLFGIVAARFYAATFQQIFSVDNTMVSAVMIIGLLVNLAVANAIFTRSTDTR